MVPFCSKQSGATGPLADLYRRHLVTLILDSERDNPLFRSPIGEDPKHILDLGTGKGVWAMYVLLNKKGIHDVASC